MLLLGKKKGRPLGGSVYLSRSGSIYLSSIGLGDTREERLMEIVVECLNQWKPDGILGFDDCKEVFERQYGRLNAAGQEPRFVASDAVGMWIVVNVLGRPSRTDEECQLIRATGVQVTHTFFDWWDA